LMLHAIEDGELPAALIDPATWLTLEQHPAADLAELAGDVHWDDSAIERRALVEELIARPAIEGDASRGHALFQENCITCHSVAGEGSEVAPALDGIGKNPREEVLASILDPNRAVDATYLLWIARTFDGQLYSGRLVSESRTSIEILEASGEIRVLLREDLESVAPSTISLMPEGFESLGEEGLADVLKFLAESP